MEPFSRSGYLHRNPHTQRAAGRSDDRSSSGLSKAWMITSRSATKPRSQIRLASGEHVSLLDVRTLPSLEGRSLVGAFDDNDLQQYLQTSRPPIAQGTLHLKYNPLCLMFVSAQSSHPRCKYDAASRYRHGNGIQPAGKVSQSSTQRALYLVLRLTKRVSCSTNSKFENQCFWEVQFLMAPPLSGQLHGTPLASQMSS